MKNSKRLLSGFFIILFCAHLLTPATAFAKNTKIFILHSYHQEYPWTKNENTGFTQTVADRFLSGNINFSTEYLDTKRIKFSTDYRNFFYQYLKQKYDHYSPDVIFCSDDAALLFLRQFKERLFGQVPVVFCGVNDLDIKEDLNRQQYTGIFEKKEIIPNLVLLKQIIPQPEHILFVGDKSATHLAIEKTIKEDIASQFTEQKYSILANDNLPYLVRQLKNYQKGIVFLTTIGGIKDENNANMPLKNILNAIVNAGNFTIVSMEDVYLEKGIFGGYVTSGYSQGEAAARLTIQIVQGHSPASIPLVTESPNQYMFNFPQLRKFGLSASQLPPKSIILNKPQSFYDQFKYRIWSAILFLIIQSIVIIALIQNIQKRKIAEISLQQAHNDLEKIVIERTAQVTKTNTSLENEIVEHRRTEEALESHNQLMSTLLDNLQVGVFMIEAPTGKPLLANRQAVRVLGRGILDGIRKSNLTEIYQAFKGETNELYPEEELPIVRGLNGEKHSVDDMVVVQPDGKQVYLEVYGSPVKDKKGNVIASLVTFSDITDRKRSEEEKEGLRAQLTQAYKMEAIGTLAGGIAHDFNNILGIIIGNMELAIDEIPEWNPAKHYLQEIKIAGLRAKDVVRQLLSFSRRSKQQRKPINIAPIVNESLLLLRATIPATIEIKAHIPDEVDTILADPTQIQQVIINLCTNAAQAMESRGGILRIDLNQLDLSDGPVKGFMDVAPGQYIQLAVNDTGHGVDPEIQDRIFDPYFTTKEVGKGTGMGLAIVHGIIMNHEGLLTVESAPGNGTEIKILFPLCGEKQAERKSFMGESPKGNERILLVDDEESLLKMTGKLLRNLGYEVVTHIHPEKAFDRFRSTPHEFDAVVTDMTMPRMTGVGLSEKMKAVRPDIPIIICTGYSSLIDEEKSKDLGISAYIMKPIAMKNLAKTVRNVLDEAKG